MSKTQPPKGFDELTVPEQIDYVNSLWERIASRPSDVPMPDWHRRELSERFEQHRENPGDVALWEDAREGVRSKLRKER